MNKNETASVYVDPQNGFTDVCPDELPVNEGTEIVPALLKQWDLAKHHIVSKDAHNRKAIWTANKDNPQFSPVEGDNVDIRWNSHCNIGEKGFELIDGLPEITDYDYVVWKGIELDLHPYGACYHDHEEKMSTGLIEYLQINKVKYVIVGGLATDYCVYLTVKQLHGKGFFVYLNLGGCRGVTPETTKDAINKMNDMANVRVIETVKELERTFQ